MPDSFLQRLVELLSIPHQGCDVLAPNIGASSPEWLEYNCRVLPPSVAGVDIEVSPRSVHGTGRSTGWVGGWNGSVDETGEENVYPALDVVCTECAGLVVWMCP